MMADHETCPELLRQEWTDRGVDVTVTSVHHGDCSPLWSRVFFCKHAMMFWVTPQAASDATLFAAAGVSSGTGPQVTDS